MCNIVPFLIMKKTPIQLPPDAVEVARVAGAWGIKGDVRIVPFNMDADALFNAKQWYILPADERFGPKTRKNETQGQGASAPHLPMLLEKFSLKNHSSGLVVSSDQIPDRNMAEALKGARIFVSKADFPELEEGEFYWVDLIGLEVENLQGEKLGTVSDLMSNGAQNILRIPYNFVNDKGIEHQAEHLIPFVDAYIIHVDLQNKRIQVDWQSSYSL